MNKKQWYLIRRFPDPSGGFVALKADSDNPRPEVNERAIIGYKREDTIEDALLSVPRAEREHAVIHSDCYELVPFDQLRFNVKSEEPFDLDGARDDISVLIAQIYDLRTRLVRAENRIDDLEENLLADD